MNGCRSLTTNFTRCGASWEGQPKTDRNPPKNGERTNRRMIRRNQITHPDISPSLGRT